MTADPLLDAARSAVRLACAKGAQEAAVRAFRVRELETVWRDGRLEKVHEATTRGLGFSLYVDGRWASTSTSDLRPDALERFVAESVALTRTLAPDPLRSLPDPKLYEGRPAGDLQIDDPGYASVGPERRRAIVRDLEAAARTAKGNDAIQSVTTVFSDSSARVVRVASNGFSGSRDETSYWIEADVSVKDAEGRRPADGESAGARLFGDLPPAGPVGVRAAERALGRRGARKAKSAVMPMVLENRAGGRLLAALLGPLAGGALQQKRSFLEGKLGALVGSPLLTVTDDPLLPKGFASRPFDAEGISSRRRPLFDRGVLATFLLDTYYAKKLGMEPTTGEHSNVLLAPGSRDLDALLADVAEGIFVTGFLGGNSNGTTGDFSVGVQGFRIRGGKLAEPVGEMNVSGNHLDLWRRLAAVGDDPYPFSTLRTPTLVFDGVQFAGS